MTEFKKLTNLRELKVGGQKKVYSAVHPTFGKVVLKHIFITSDSLERTKREIRAVSLLNSVNIPNILAHNCDEANPHPIWIIEQFISGKNLRDLLTEGFHFNTMQIVNLLETILTILVKAEENNLVHRDIKPENIMLDKEGKFWLLDFGISRHLDLESITQSNSPFGLFTFGYASSEQFKNLKKDIDIRADLFSLGVLCHELIQEKNFYISGSENDLFMILKRLENQSLPRIRIKGDTQFKLSAFITLLGDHRRYRRPANARKAMEILSTILESIDIK